MRQSLAVKPIGLGSMSNGTKKLDAKIAQESCLSMLSASRAWRALKPAVSRAVKS